MTGTLRPLDVVMLPDGRMDAKNAATYCGLSVKTLAMKRCDGNGPKFVKLGRVFYFRDDLDEWLRGNRATSTAQVRQMT
ncbi:DNA-binding protein [Candidatus Competibacter phosphatis]|uniref:DNA-binding protein n=1 Tax=Candidatus Competibacter phosphatis TaxID=221280 RepID=A0ABX1TR25_9GAMM|nr:helix-turn-helix domain-containing protein [Candidatus Competibacter phosphatis]NMQ20810.1 DNA-binding protein [Candidatus Competibacter phosphatis]